MKRAALSLALVCACNAPGPSKKPRDPAQPAAAFTPLPSTPQALTLPPSIPRGSLFALANEPSALAIGPQATVTLDAAFVNGTATAATHAQLAGTFTAVGDVALDSHATLAGDLTTGGALKLGAKASVSGAVAQHAPVTPVVLPTTDQLLSQMSLSFGGAAPSVIVAAHAQATLPAGASRVGAVELGPGATLTVTGAVDLEVTDHVTLASQSSIVVQTGARLRLHLLGRLDVGPHASIVQVGSSKNALVLLLGANAQATFAPGVTFGPGLFYAPESALTGGAAGEPLAGLDTFTGAIVARRVSTNEHATLTLDAGYLLCPFDTSGPTVTIAHPSGGVERSVAPGTATIAVSGVIADDAGVATATLTDAAGTSPLALDAGGAFTATAHLRADGDPTTICVDAVGCGGQTSEQCVLIGVRHDVQFVFISPQPGAILSVDHVNITGRVVSGAVASIQAEGTSGFVGPGGDFTIPGVSLAPGLNVIAVRATATSGDVSTRRLLVSRGPMPARTMALRVDEQQLVHVESTAARPPLSFRPPANGAMQYRLLDATGAELYRGSVPGTMPATYHVLDASGLPRTPPGPSSIYHPKVIVPALAAGTTIEFLDGQGQRIGSGSL